MPQLLTDTEIANLALSKLGPGGGYLTSLESDQTEAAEALQRVYVGIRDEVLEAYAWSFAQARASLPEDTATPAWGYGHQYSLPPDCLKVLSIEGLAVLDTAAYTIEGNKLLTDNEAPLNIRYLARPASPAKYSATFVAAFAARLADEICEVITKSTTKREALQKEYFVKLKQARRVDGMGRAPQPPRDGAWNESRWTG